MDHLEWTSPTQWGSTNRNRTSFQVCHEVGCGQPTFFAVLYTDQGLWIPVSRRSNIWYWSAHQHSSLCFVWASHACSCRHAVMHERIAKAYKNHNFPPTELFSAYQSLQDSSCWWVISHKSESSLESIRVEICAESEVFLTFWIGVSNSNVQTLCTLPGHSPIIRRLVSSLVFTWHLTCTPPCSALQTNYMQTVPGVIHQT